MVWRVIENERGKKRERHRAGEAEGERRQHLVIRILVRDTTDHVLLTYYNHHRFDYVLIISIWCVFCYHQLREYENCLSNDYFSSCVMLSVMVFVLCLSPYEA